MGQFSGKGPTKVWDMNPSAKGKHYFGEQTKCKAVMFRCKNVKMFRYCVYTDMLISFTEC